jgi:aldehyde:ferredoxin oxidoreductase
MTGGYAGKILQIDLTTQNISTVDTSKYAEYGGGMGIATALFWDLCASKLPFEAFDPQNATIIMSSPLNGTAAPGVARCVMTGLGPQSYPVEWYTHSSMDGRLGAMMKAAGWDGIAVYGKSAEPVWINIVNDKVSFVDATDLWGKDTQTTQQTIWNEVLNPITSSGWAELSDAEKGRSTQNPIVACIVRLEK